MNVKGRDTEIVRAEIREITPEMALSMLEHNYGNRRVASPYTSELAGYIRNGLWKENGESIIISEDGVLLDGQHRLSAVVMANKSIKSLVAWVKESDDQGALTAMNCIIDRGRIRSYSDISGISPFCDRVAGTMIRDYVTNGAILSKNVAVRTAVYECFQDEIDTVKDRCGITKRGISRASVLGVIALRLKEGFDHTGEFRAVLTTQAGLSVGWASWLKRIGAIEKNGKPERKTLIAATWQLTEPYRNQNKTLLIKNPDKKYEEAKTVFHGYAMSSIQSVIDYKG